jgi:MFS family permease
MITLITYGAGMLLGSWLSGAVVDHYATVGTNNVVAHDWRSIWLVSAACSGVVLLLFFLTFSEREPSPGILSEAIAVAGEPVGN